MATTTARRHSAVHPVTKVWNQTKNLEYSEELEYPDMVKELYTPEEAYELTMKDIKAIYDVKDAV